MRGIPISEKYRGIKSDGIIYRGLGKYTAVYYSAVLIFNKLSSRHNLFHFVVHCVLLPHAMNCVRFCFWRCDFFVCV